MARGFHSIFALNTYSWSGFPGLESWLARWNAPDAAIWLSPMAWVHRVGEWSSSVCLASAALLELGLWFGGESRENPVERSGSFSLKMVGALLFAAFAPNFLLACTYKYQMWSHQRMWPYYYTSMSYLAWVVLLVGAWLRLMDYVRNYSLRRACWALMAVGAIGVGAANNQAVTMLRKHPFYHMSQYREWGFPP